MLAHEEERPRTAVRIVVGIVVLLLLWFLGRTFLGVFRDSTTEGASIRLTLEEGAADNVRVSFQDEESVRAESGLKLYEGDALTTYPGGAAVLSFFDGSRMRLDEGTDVSIEEHRRVENGTSRVQLTFSQGSLWVETATPSAFTGSIERVIELPTYRAELPPGTSGFFSSDLIFLTESQGLGATITFTLDNEPSIVLGEGQSFALTQDVRSRLEAGTDPYTYRDPVKTAMLNRPFVQESRRLFRESETVPGIGIDTETGSTAESVLVITQPADNAVIETSTVMVSGRVTARVQSLAVNGRDVRIDDDRTFTHELTLSDSAAETMLRIEAKDAQGVVIADTSRMITRRLPPPGAPVITTPGASGATVTVTEGEVEIQGTVPVSTDGIMVNEYRLQLFKAGSRQWSYLASAALGNMKPGENVYRIYALNAAGTKSGGATITINYVPSGTVGTGSSVSSQPPVTSLPTNAPLKPGSLTVAKPAAGTSHETTETELLIEGNVPPETASVWVNDYQLQLYEAGKTFWNYIASTELNTLKNGRNVYRVVARDSQNRIIDAIEYEITLTR